MDMHEALECFRDRVVGQKVRGIVVEDVELGIETCGQGPMRFFITTHFQEPCIPANMQGELQLLKRVFNEVNYAVLRCTDAADAKARMTGETPCHDEEWVLEDEM